MFEFELFYGEIIAGGGTPPKFGTMLPGCMEYVSTNGEIIHYGKSTLPNPIDEKPDTVPSNNRYLKKWYPDIFH